MELGEMGLFGVGREGPLWSWKRRASLELREKGLFGVERRVSLEMREKGLFGSEREEPLWS